jgi:hypothetical protein
MPEGHNADPALHIDTNSYIWTYEHKNAHLSNQIGVRI